MSMLKYSKDYGYAFKISIIQEIESGVLWIKAAIKYGIQSHSSVITG